MGTIYRKQYTLPIPTDAKLITRKGKQLAQWTSRNGKLKTAELNEAGDRIRCETGTYIAKYRDGDGVVCEVSTGCRDKQAAMSVLNDLETMAERVKANIITSAEAKIGELFADMPLTDHIEDYIRHLKERRVHPDRVKNTETRLKESATGCGFRFMRDMNADSLQRWLGEQVTGKRKMSASVHNGFVQVWISFGNWLNGKRIHGNRATMKGEVRFLNNPFEGMGKLDEKADPKRKARALTDDELERLLEAARKRPLEVALTIRKGPKKGEMVAKVSDERKSELLQLGEERALIYKTAVLTGLRLNELRTLINSDLSFGDVPFVRLRPTNEKNRKGSTLPLRSDLAAELKEWTNGKDREAPVFVVPAGLLRIMDRDLVVAKIPKHDADGRVVHVHALRHSFGTHLSLGGVLPRTAQAAMRHSNISLTMNTYTDSRLLDIASAVESIQLLRTLAPNLAPDSVDQGQIESIPGYFADQQEGDSETKKPCNPLGITGFSLIGPAGFEPTTSTTPR
jgi:integrase